MRGKESNHEECWVTTFQQPCLYQVIEVLEHCKIVWRHKNLIMCLVLFLRCIQQDLPSHTHLRRVWSSSHLQATSLRNAFYYRRLLTYIKQMYINDLDSFFILWIGFLSYRDSFLLFYDLGLGFWSSGLIGFCSSLVLLSPFGFGVFIIVQCYKPVFQGLLFIKRF